MVVGKLLEAREARKVLLQCSTGQGIQPEWPVFAVHVESLANEHFSTLASLMLLVYGRDDPEGVMRVLPLPRFPSSSP